MVGLKQIVIVIKQPTNLVKGYQHGLVGSLTFLTEDSGGSWFFLLTAGKTEVALIDGMDLHH